jgi:hypothetical protein
MQPVTRRDPLIRDSSPPIGGILDPESDVSLTVLKTKTEYMASSQSRKKVEVCESEIQQRGLDVVKYRFSRLHGVFKPEPWHIPEGSEEDLLRELAEHVDGCEVVSSE